MPSGKLIFESGRDDGHGAVLGADKGAHFDGRLVRLADGFATKDLRHERAGERVSCSDGVCDGDLGGWKE